MQKRKQREMAKSKRTGPVPLSKQTCSDRALEGTPSSSTKILPSSRSKSVWNFSDGATTALTVPNNTCEPFGFIAGNFNAIDEKKKVDKSAQDEKIKASAMAVATAPGKQLLMNCFMMWMSGSSLQIFSIMMICMGLWGPLQKIANINQEFARYAASKVDLTMPKLVFIALNLLGTGIALYKCQTLGLLPTGQMDWMNTHDVRPAREFAAGGLSF